MAVANPTNKTASIKAETKGGMAKAMPKTAPAKAKPAPAVRNPTASSTPAAGAKVLAIIRVRGVTGLHPKRAHTMDLLNVSRSNCASLVIDTPITRGMLHNCKDYMAWGPVSVKMVEHMLTKRGYIGGKRINAVKKPAEITEIANKLFAGSATLKSLELNRVFHLTPPSGGWKDKKRTYPVGDLGPRPDMDSLLKCMV